MINTQLNFEGEIPMGQYPSQLLKFEAKIPERFKRCCTRNYTKFLSLKANLTLKVKVTTFQTRRRYLDDQ